MVVQGCSNKKEGYFWSKATVSMALRLAMVLHAAQKITVELLSSSFDRVVMRD